MTASASDQGDENRTDRRVTVRGPLSCVGLPTCCSITSTNYRSTTSLTCQAIELVARSRRLSLTAAGTTASLDEHYDNTARHTDQQRSKLPRW